MNIIVIGSGGREHAICWKLAQSSQVEKIICVPGNGGTAKELKCKNISINDCNYISGNSENPFVQIAKHENCTLAVIGPEEPLANGTADDFWKAGIKCVGPKKDAAQLEASKDFAKSFMSKYSVACAKSKTFTDKKLAEDYVKQNKAPIVIKADGLAAGKGVVVAATEQEALNAVKDIMQSEAGKKIVIEEYLEGIEISVLAAVSVLPESESPVIVPFLPARDHKRLNDGATGPNTGGMGAVCPLDDVSPQIMAQFNKDILEPTIKGLIEEKFDYRGFIFFGVMLTQDGPKLLEYNVRLGDPETQAVLPLMDSDFANLCISIADGNLNKLELSWKKGYQVAPVIVSEGYPGAYPKGRPIAIDEKAVSESSAKIFAAGAIANRRAGGISSMVTGGGRVLSCSAYGASFIEAWNNAYKAIKAVYFEGAFYRKDIGLPGAAESKHIGTS